MGDIRKYKSDCGYEETVKTGQGLQSIRQASIEKLFPDKIKELKSEENDLLSAVTCIHLGLCRKCKRIVPVNCLNRIYKDGSEDMFHKGCPECGQKVVVLDDPDNISCPKCGKLMDMEICGHWD